jgi:predicted transcriptional regulator
MEEAGKNNLTELTAEIVSAYVARNNVPASELPSLLQSVHSALGRIATGGATVEQKPEPLVPAVPIKKSIMDDYLISLENGQKFKSLKRHLMTTYNMTPQQYREKWGLPKDYPMVAPAYAKSRSALAKSLGLGRKAAVPVEAPPAAPAGKEPGAKPTRARRAKAA